ncbi:N-acetyltransferase [Bacteroides sp. 224]|uniref:N-acetyltransferase n=1 Tax=Bacteroides sp. 224 TaxID=2302936 RepID=UPI0013D783C2|nr:N-acetyltransferase [Bacteroides sp. 224]NDV64881.1 GNAT family N-acetyltransferase [Bacteroides sp. 224]
MEATFITLNKENIGKEHICCAFSDKKCKDSYELKKEWLKKEFDNGYVFRRLNERAKVFIEYTPAEKAWVPVEAPNWLMINCFWVSGQYKGKGYAKALLQTAIDDAKQQGKEGLVTIVGTKKFHFMSDPKWLIRQGFETVQTLPYGFSLLALKLKPEADTPSFNENTLSGECPDKNGIVVYYSNRCPFTEYHIQNSLQETAQKRNLPVKVIKFTGMEEAKDSPTPATIFSLYYNGKFVTTDLSTCMDSRFDKVVVGISG